MRIRRMAEEEDTLKGKGKRRKMAEKDGCEIEKGPGMRRRQRRATEKNGKERELRRRRRSRTGD